MHCHCCDRLFYSILFFSLPLQSKTHQFISALRRCNPSLDYSLLCHRLATPNLAAPLQIIASLRFAFAVTTQFRSMLCRCYAVHLRALPLLGSSVLCLSALCLCVELRFTAVHCLCVELRFTAVLCLCFTHLFMTMLSLCLDNHFVAMQFLCHA